LAVEEGQLELNFAVLWRQCASPEADVWIFDAIARFLESLNLIKNDVNLLLSGFQQATQKYGCSRSIVISIGQMDTAHTLHPSKVVEPNASPSAGER